MVKKVDVEKKWYLSKTLWCNIIVIAIGVLQWVSGQIEAGATITTIGFVNAVLRVISKHKLQFD